MALIQTDRGNLALEFADFIRMARRRAVQHVQRQLGEAQYVPNVQARVLYSDTSARWYLNVHAPSWSREYSTTIPRKFYTLFTTTCPAIVPANKEQQS